MENIVKKLDVKKDSGEHEITNKMIKLTFDRIKKTFENCSIVPYAMGIIQKCSKNHK